MTSVGLLVVGSGPAGVHAAAAYLRAGGAGSVLLVSADRDAPYQRPPLSKGVLAGDDPVEGTAILDDEDDLDAWRRVEVELGTRVEAVDVVRRSVLCDDGRRLPYDRLVLATGSAPVPLPGADADAPVHLLRSLEQARAVVGALDGAGTVVVVGSGFIGCEAAAALAGRGLRTVLVTPEHAPQAARLGDWAGGRIATWLIAAGVELRTGVEVESVARTGVVHLGDGEEVPADLVLAAVGVQQDQPLLRTIDVEVDEGRVVVDAGMRSTDEHVWAVGDVAAAHHPVAGRTLTVEHWGDAIAMGRTAGANAAAASLDTPDAATEWSDPPGFWSEIGGHTLKYSAWGDGFDRASVVEHDAGSFTVWYADEDGELVGVLTHGCDDDYERGGDLLARRATLAESLETGG
ncbi:NAD(P)/FAD-dependent oxidoreductase [Nocardioides currus]|uniref:N-acyl-D-glutamate deacylase n=1 Tax=Nocardioides currus TaxID=2133958 RepID=A0A2R7YUU4_9ACTN|nr:NAD(P)/FAD-dependent oxidoreductase [Nocardioides currus]PUA80138.1 N-acyl-D-glutamate deacylase [Nocardioides currus]